MTVRQRLVLSIVGISALLVIPAIYSLTRLDALRGIASAQRNRHGEAYLALGGLQARLAELDRLQRTYVVLGEEAARRDIHAALDSADARLADLRRAEYGPQSAAVAAAVRDLRQATVRIEQLIAANQPNEASEYMETVWPIYGRAQIALRQLYSVVDEESQRQLNSARLISSGAMGTTIIALLICATFAFLFGAWTTRALTTPVMRLNESMALVADGEFRVPENLPYDRRDEIGSVSRSFRAMTHRLADLDRLKAEFMSISTHELKTPINVISGYAELIQEGVYGELSPKQEEALASIREQARVLTQLVNQLLDVSRLEAGGMRLHFHEVSVRDLIGRVQRSFEGLATKKGIDLVVSIDAGTPSSIPGDADRLADQVLGNLLSNALKFTPDGGRIEVRTRLHDDGLIIEVEDSGPGIPADQLPYIFDKYFQVGEQARSKGAGLGLAIAHEVVTAHGGRISAASEHGTGTTFRVVLPTNGGAGQTHLAEPVEEAAH